MCVYLSHILLVAEKDVFDKLFEEAPEKLEPVKRVSESWFYMNTLLYVCVPIPVTVSVCYQSLTGT